MTEAGDEGRTGGMMMFKKTRNKVKMDPASARRQGDIVGVAMATLGDTKAVMAFLNGNHADLGARPLEVATESQAGFEKVRSLLAGS